MDDKEFKAPTMWGRMRIVLRAVLALAAKKKRTARSQSANAVYDLVVCERGWSTGAIPSHCDSPQVGLGDENRNHQEDSGVELMGNEKSGLSPGSSFESGRASPESYCTDESCADNFNDNAFESCPVVIPTLIEDILEEGEGPAEMHSEARSPRLPPRSVGRSKDPLRRLQSECCFASGGRATLSVYHDSDEGSHSADERELQRLRNPLESQDSSDSLPDPDLSATFGEHQNSDAQKLGSKRQKMEELKSMYKHFENTRGSADLYQTMLDVYADFLSDQGSNDTNNNMLSMLSKPEMVRTFSVEQERSTREELMRRDLVLTELADTEKDYVDYLGFVVHIFIPFLRVSEEVSQGLKDDLPTIFANIEDIYDWHSTIFHVNLENCLEEPDLIGATFSECEAEMASLYSHYCRCKPAADNALSLHEEELEQLRTSCLDMKLNIKDYLIKPVQRLMKYQLLLTLVKKHTAKAGIPVKHVEAALEVMSYVPKEANNAMHVAMIQGYEDDLSNQELIFQDTLDVAIGKNKAKPRPMRVFVFEEDLLFTEAVPRSGQLPLYQLLAYGKTSRMGITEVVENDQRKFAIYFRKFRKTDIFVCQTDTVQMKESWTRVLLDIIQVQSPLRKKSCSRKPSNTDLTRPRSRRPRTCSYEESIKNSVAGHPRAEAMSDKLKRNIEKFILSELILQEGKSVAEKNNPKVRTRSKSVESSRRAFGESCLGMADGRDRSFSSTAAVPWTLPRLHTVAREPR